MKAKRAIAVAAAGTIAAAVAVIGADTASAATPRPFCVGGYNACAIAERSNPVFMPYGAIHVTSWLYNGVGHNGQIQENGTGLCMQLNHNAGDVVIEAACNGASYQEWDPYYLNGSIVYASEWGDHGCLTYNRQHAWLDVIPCDGNWYQNFPGN